MKLFNKNSVKKTAINNKIKKLEETMTILKRNNKYFSKPYTIKEIQEVLSRKKTVTIYLTFEKKKLIIEHIRDYNSLISVDLYFFQGKDFSSINGIFECTSILGVSLKENWDKVTIQIMVDEDFQQVL